MTDETGKTQEAEKNKTSVKTSVLAFCVLLAVLGAYIPSHISVALEPSVGYRVFLLRDRNPSKPLVAGDFVIYKKKGDAMHKGGNAVKEVGCVPGSVLKVDSASRTFFCGERYLGVAKTATIKGQPLTLFEWNGPVPEGKFFAYGSSKDSYDSRYTGWVDITIVEHIAYPIW